MTDRWMIPRESTEWVGPIVPSATTLAGAPVTLTAGMVKFAVLKLDVRPAAGDWQSVVTDPGGSGAFGLTVAPVAGYVRQGVWVKITNGADIVILEPYEVGLITRT